MYTGSDDGKRRGEDAGAKERRRDAAALTELLPHIKNARCPHSVAGAPCLKCPLLTFQP